MGRKPTISRDSLLSLAEQIVNAEGPQALTIDALAKAAGISKGGVQYSFASKDELIGALLERWRVQFDTLVVDIDAEGPVAFVRSYIAAMRSPHGALDAKSAGLMVTYMQNPQNRRDSADWYQMIIAKLGDTEEARAARVAFLAVEGLFLTRLIGVDDADAWQAALDDIVASFEAAVGEKGISAALDP